MTTTGINNSEKIGYGFKDGKLIHISEVESGLVCDCTCPVCSTPLIAKKGQINTHHFAHHELSDCDNVNESILHKLGKSIIAEHQKVRIPAMDIEVTGRDLLDEIHTQRSQDHEYTLSFNEFGLEQSFKDFRPDITVVTEGNQKVFIEIVVTNSVSDDKLAKVKQHPHPMLSIDLGGIDPLADRKTIEEAVIYGAEREWVYNPEIDEIHRDLAEALKYQIKYTNNDIRNKVLDHYNITPSEQGSQLPEPGFGEVIVLGYTSVHGFSKKTNRDYDISQLYVIEPLQRTSGPNYNIRGQGGSETKEISFSPDLMPELENLAMPCVIKPKFDNLYVGGRVREVVVGLG